VHLLSGKLALLPCWAIFLRQNPMVIKCLQCGVSNYDGIVHGFDDYATERVRPSVLKKLFGMSRRSYKYVHV